MELENTLLLTRQILDSTDPEVELKEVIVATPNPRLAKTLANMDPRIIVLLETRREGKVAALNNIIRYATGDILVLASADIRLSRDTVPRLVKALALNPDWGAVDSRIELENGRQLIMDKVDNLLWSIHNATLDDLSSKNDLGHAGDLLAVRRDLVGQFPDVVNDDGYLALSVRERGFKVKRVQNANVRITGPRSPSDYVYQRSRILRGHLQLIMMFRRIPTTFEFEAIRSPRRALGLVVEAVASLGPRGLLTIFVAALLELASFQVAVFSSLFKRANRPWRIVETTKRLETR